MNAWKVLRVVLALAAFAGINLFLLGLAGGCGWLAKAQLLPALLAGNAIAAAAVAAITLVCGRVYCSVLCPLGVLQDGLARLLPRRKGTGCSAPRWGLRIAVFVASVGAAAVAASYVRGVRAAEARVTAVDGIPLPDWAVKQIEDGAARYTAWKGADETVVFPLITDIHSHSGGDPAQPNWRDSKFHILFQRAIAHRVGADYLANLGDLDFDVDILGKAPEWSRVQPVIDSFVKLYEKETLPVLYSMGNHDHAKGRYTSKQFGDTFNRALTEKKGHPVTLSEDGTWGRLDLVAKKFRVIFLNTSDEGYLGVSRAQAQFLADSLASLEDGWTVLVEQHAQMPPFMGSWRRFMGSSGEFKRDCIVMHMLDDFVNRRGDLVEGFHNPPIKGSYDKIAWDFSHAKGALAGDFSGHTHLESNLCIAGVNYVTRPGYGTSPVDCPSFGARDPKRAYGGRGGTPAEQMMIDLVAVKTAKRQVHVFRFGWGGPESELEYAY